MSKITETCSCGASLSLDSEIEPMVGLISVVKTWREEHHHHRGDEFHPSGGNVAYTERKYDTTPHELDADTQRGPYGRRAGF